MTITSARPSYFVVTIDDARNHLQITHDEDNAMIDQLIATAQEYIELSTHLFLTARDVTIVIDTLDEILELPYYPVNSVVSIKYYDEDNTLQTLSASDYTLYTTRPAKIKFETIPNLYDRPDAVQIVVNCGYSNVGDVPMNLKHGVKLLLTALYENRSEIAAVKLEHNAIGIDYLLGNYYARI